MSALASPWTEEDRGSQGFRSPSTLDTEGKVHVRLYRFRGMLAVVHLLVSASAESGKRSARLAFWSVKDVKTKRVHVGYVQKARLFTVVGRYEAVVYPRWCKAPAYLMLTTLGLDCDESLFALVPPTLPMADGDAPCSSLTRGYLAKTCLGTTCHIFACQIPHDSWLNGPALHFMLVWRLHGC